MKALELAMKMEEDAIRYYREAAANCPHPAGRRMFQVVMDEEEQHLENLRNISQNRDVELSAPGASVQLDAVLETLRDRGRLDAACSLDDMEAFRIAMDMEKEGYEFYKAQAARASSKEEKALFEWLAQEEERHFEVLSETHSFLSDTGNWFMWDEHSIVEG
jgi:rubrerythrin